MNPHENTSLINFQRGGRTGDGGRGGRFVPKVALQENREGSNNYYIHVYPSAFSDYVTHFPDLVSVSHSIILSIPKLAGNLSV